MSVENAARPGVSCDEMKTNQTTATLIGITTLALVAFAANSLLARAALGTSATDPAGYTVVRLASGAAFLALVLALRQRKAEPPGKLEGSWISAAALFAYAIAFSIAYVRLGAATGALILFASVQISMLSWSLYLGERLRPLQLVGMVLALGGILYLLLPGIGSPDPIGSVLMVLSGASWAVYTMRGRGIRDPVGATAGNFIRSVAFCVPLLAIGWSSLAMTTHGLVLAVASGVLASGLGYVLWYRVLPDLAATTAAFLQLTVPIIAAAGAILFLGEAMTARFVIASVLALGGVALTIVARRR